MQVDERNLFFYLRKSVKSVSSPIDSTSTNQRFVKLVIGAGRVLLLRPSARLLEPLVPPIQELPIRPVLF